ncbi:Mutator-like transposase [Cucumis melo var. makuwa]|uniref:Mutator-like transposase n=1 Tax=Cucumis melo var. makuwa TaxID=1194695 RepID=A0A5D3B7F8_CUCMM|nr:Mutator-like transposase [Cucumis melo var. makuwa]
MLVMSKFSDNDLLVVVDSVFVGDVENTPYLSSELPRAQDSRNETGIIDLDAFESAHTGSMSSFGRYQLYEDSPRSECKYKAWRGHETALNSIRETYTTEEADDEGQFKFYFMALAASINAWNYCVLVILVDDATMKNKYFGTLISACTIDDNSQIVPLAFAVVDSENDLSWA